MKLETLIRERIKEIQAEIELCLPGTGKIYQKAKLEKQLEANKNLLTITTNQEQ